MLKVFSTRLAVRIFRRYRGPSRAQNALHIGWRRSVNERVGIRRGRSLFLRCQIHAVLELEALQLFSQRHQNKEIQREALTRRHLFGAIAQSGRQMQNYIFEFLLDQSHCLSLRDGCPQEKYGWVGWLLQWHDGVTSDGP